MTILSAYLSCLPVPAQQIATLSHISSFSKISRAVFKAPNEIHRCASSASKSQILGINNCQAYSKRTFVDALSDSWEGLGRKECFGASVPEDGPISSTS